MAVIWSHNRKGTRYEVRTAGNSVRLYTDGIFHSQWNPRRPLGGNLWDLFILPAFMLEHATINNALVLGVGGGAILRQMEYFFQPQAVEAVDLDPVHLRIARRFFHNRADHLTLVHDNALDTVARKQGNASHDYLVEDLFMADAAGEPVRALAADQQWVEQLARLVARRGTLVMNFESLHQLRRSPGYQWLVARRVFTTRFCLSRPEYHNAIAVFSRRPLVNQHRSLLEARLRGTGLPASMIRQALEYQLHYL